MGGVFLEGDQTCSVHDPADGLPVSCVGAWAEQKQARIRKYVNISRATRRKYTQGPGGSSYIDLFCGPGRARVRYTDRLIDGSCLVAARSAIEGGVPFTEAHIGDANKEFVSAATVRLGSLGVTVKAYVGSAQYTVQQIANALGRYALHFALLDPYDLKSLPFSVIEALASLKHMDMLIHVSAMDLQRNLHRYIEGSESALDDFAPAWRNVVNVMNKQSTVRMQVIEHWVNLLRKANMQVSKGGELVTGTRKQHLYWLIFVAHHSLAMQFWEEIRNISDQKSLDL